MKLILILAVAAGLVCGCTAFEEGPKYTNPATPIQWTLPTQSEARTAPCPSTELAAVQVGWDQVTRGLTLGGEKVVLPNGFSARILPSGRLEILAPDGSVVARDGDTLSLGGADYMHVCRVQGVIY
jgi:hypothetical protein